ncbi:hypothetical protein PG993_000838 [Apiospora rasikravindrae]|uniref:Uncharacterized protein n=1 Tax=Apiospora rasikravindrae TaxID=990691 RepID=A0ABR1UBR2_9PEZI
MALKASVQSPNPTRSRLCLLLAIIVYTGLFVAWCCRKAAVESPGSDENIKFWAMVLVNYCNSAVLLCGHLEMRFDTQPKKSDPHWTHNRPGGYNDERYEDFYRAACTSAGIITTCAMALYCVVWSQHGGG